jgi:hypothetical protein
MRISTRLCLSILALSLSSVALASSAVESLLAEYRQQGAGPFNAAAGQTFWNQAVRHKATDSERSCASCHTRDLHQTGRHAVTGKLIKPMAPSVLSRRLTNPAKIRKWLRRNCLWTRGRECTAQEKGDLLSYLKDL